MKIILIIILIFLFSCSKPNSQNPDWLIGNWQRINDSSGRQTFEYWEKAGENIYEGIGFTLQDADTVFKENLKLVQVNGIWNYEVSGVHEKPVYFTFTSLSKNHFVCENMQNDFPRKIEYYISSDTLKAVISAGKKKIPFIFTQLP